MNRYRHFLSLMCPSLSSPNLPVNKLLLISSRGKQFFCWVNAETCDPILSTKIVQVIERQEPNARRKRKKKRAQDFPEPIYERHIY